MKTKLLNLISDKVVPLKITLITFVGAFICGFAACFCWQLFADCGVDPHVKDRVPSLEEIQTKIGAEPDGIFGPETREKWNRAICNQFAAPYHREN